MFIEAECIDNKCAQCQKKSASLSRCSRCLKVYYCSAVCQKAHYSQHQPVCILSPLYGRILSLVGLAEREDAVFDVASVTSCSPPPLPSRFFKALHPTKESPSPTGAGTSCIPLRTHCTLGDSSGGVTSDGLRRGVFALHDLEVGTLVLREKPLLECPADNRESLPEQWYALPSAQQEAVAALQLPPSMLEDPSEPAGASLCAAASSEDGPAPALSTSQLRAVYRRYHMDMQWKSRGTILAVAASQFRHHCVPNVVVHWNEIRELVEVRCVLPVRAGEELTRCFTDARDPASERAEALAEHWDLQCHCEACGPNAGIHDNRRIALGMERTYEAGDGYCTKIRVDGFLPGLTGAAGHPPGTPCKLTAKGVADHLRDVLAERLASEVPLAASRAAHLLVRCGYLEAALRWVALSRLVEALTLPSNLESSVRRVDCDITPVLPRAAIVDSSQFK